LLRVGDERDRAECCCEQTHRTPPPGGV